MLATSQQKKDILLKSILTQMIKSVSITAIQSCMRVRLKINLKIDSLSCEKYDVTT